MSIKARLLVIIGLVSLVLGVAAWQLLASSYRVEQRVRLFVPATGYLLGIAEVNTGLTRQAKEALDYLVYGDQSERTEFAHLTKEVERGFDLWIRSAETQSQLGVDGELEDIGEAKELREAYLRWVRNVQSTFALIDQGDRPQALMQYGQDASILLEQQIFAGIDMAMQDGFNEVENAYHELLLAMGGSFLGRYEDQEMLNTTHAVIDYMFSGSRVNSALGRQFSALSTYLLSGDPKSLARYEKLKVEVRGAIYEWLTVAGKQAVAPELQLSLPVADVVANLEKTLNLQDQAVAYQQAGECRRALQLIVDSPMEGTIGNHLPMMVFSALQSGSQELVNLTSKASRQGAIFVGMAFLCVLLLALQMSRNLLGSLRTIQSGMDAVSAGNLQQQIKLSGRDELARLAGHFNRMAENLNQSRIEVNQLNAELEQRVTTRTGELSKANQDLEAFNAAVSHDLRTPLSTIIGYGELLLEDEPATDIVRKESLETIIAAGQKMDRIIDTLLDLSKMNTIQLQRTSVDLTELVEGVAARVQRQNPRQAVNFKVEPRLTVEADYDLLMIAVENLLSNAWKYSAGKNPAEIEFGAAYDNERRFFFVRDNGAGFDMAQAKNLFRPFQRLHSQTEFAGTGVGLATVQRIVQCHGGEIWAEGEVDAGATFYFTLP